jgi:hypothetical protein
MLQKEYTYTPQAEGVSGFTFVIIEATEKFFTIFVFDTNKIEKISINNFNKNLLYLKENK